jgi:hypothetical protein
MGQTLTLPDELYARLDTAARRRGVSIEELLRAWQAADDVTEAELSRRRAAVARLDALRTELATRYGEMPDSTDLVRADRAR